MTQTKPTHGGARPGAGRKPNPKPVPVPVHERDMLKLLTDIATGVIDATPNQVRAAIAAVQYTHIKKHDGGKRDEQAEKAKKANSGKFAPMRAPLVLLK
jgi:phage terminase small subunit